MLITLVDDSIPYNGTTPSYQPLGGAEKAFASLPAALARCGHVVRAITRAPHALSIDNVSWLNFDGRIPPITEVLIALRKPSLLETTRATNSRILWVPGPTGYLGRHEVLDLLERNDAKIVLQGITHVEKYDVESELSYRAITPGVREEYREAEEMQPATTPIAIVTTHPKQGLDWLLDLWCAKIEPQVKGAELHVYSAMFRNAEDGEPVADDVKPVWDKVVAAHEQGVRVKAPAGDNDMARHYPSDPAVRNHYGRAGPR